MMKRIILSLKKHRAIVLTVLGVIIVLATAGGLWWLYKVNSDPTVVWYRSLDKSLQLSSYKADGHETQSGQDGYDLMWHESVDSSKLNQERASAHLKFDYAYLQVEYDTVGTADTEYMNFQKAQAISLDGIVYQSTPNILNKWVKGYENYRESVHTPLNDTLTVAHLGSEIQPSGVFPTGNFKPEMRDKVIRYAKQINLYGDISHPKKVKEGGSEVYVYIFQFDPAKNTQFSDYVDSVTGRIKKPTETEKGVKEDKSPYKATNWRVTVDPKTSYITRIQISSQNGERQKDLHFFDFNQPRVTISFPTPTITPEQFNAGFSY